jgi:hypothetical protein
MQSVENVEVQIVRSWPESLGRDAKPPPVHTLSLHVECSPCNGHVEG